MKNNRNLYFLFTFLLLYAIDFYFDVINIDAFVWMDPQQYYSFALDFVNNVRSFNQFEIASVFPFLLVPFLYISKTITSALFVNLFVVFGIYFAVKKLIQCLNISSNPVAVYITAICSPLLLGLSRSVYIELALSLIVAINFVYFFRIISDFGFDFTQSVKYKFSFRSPALFSKNNRYFILLFLFGCLLKMTYFLYFTGPALLILFIMYKNRSFKNILRFSLLFVVPAFLYLFIELFIFSQGLDYLLTFGQSSLNIMKYVGPYNLLTADSIFYYFEQMWKTSLFIYLFLLLIPIYSIIKTKKLPLYQVFLLLWMIFPFLILVFNTSKMPRIMAPSVIPAILFIFSGISSFGNNKKLVFLTLALAVVNYFIVTMHIKDTPYFVDQKSEFKTILSSIIEADKPHYKYFNNETDSENTRWKFTRNFAIKGFTPEMACLFTWNLGPASVYDLNMLYADSLNMMQPYYNFDDIRFITGLNSYNRRSLWNKYYYTLSEKEVINNADYIFIRTDAITNNYCYPNFTKIKSFSTQYGIVTVYKNKFDSTASYRFLYAQKYLNDGKNQSENTILAVYSDIALDATLREDFKTADIYYKNFEMLYNEKGVKNIYFTPDYRFLMSLSRAIMNERMKLLVR